MFPLATTMPTRKSPKGYGGACLHSTGSSPKFQFPCFNKRRKGIVEYIKN